ncbi:hypothetical protein PRN20_11425 [Devosia sp. ZB163]|uniref:hypothetical protein n=1 Tax=Devosia sp. ZB163 TaxID=3025938 RepID=UPI00236017E3|nr:hypothetical protein [Devosia sp. ZB163]MDC9824346.1 hypothetical protein [Devosia sp. ZB163]
MRDFSAMGSKPNTQGLLFPIRRAVARAAYRSRYRRRNADNFPTVFRVPGSLISEDIRRLKEIDPELDGIALLEKLAAQRSEILQTSRRWSLVSLLLTAYLLLASFSIELTVSIEGVSLAKTPGLREVSVLIIAMIGVSLLPRALNVYQLGMAISGLARAYYPPELHPFLHSAYFPAEPPSPYYTRLQPELIWSSWFGLFVRASGYFWYAFGASILVLIVWARITIYVFVWSNPTIDPLITKGIVGVAAAIDAAWLSVQILHMLPVPMTNWARLHELEIAQSIESPEARKLSRALYADDLRDIKEMERLGYFERPQPLAEPEAAPTVSAPPPQHIRAALDLRGFFRSLRTSFLVRVSSMTIVRTRPDLSDNRDEARQGAGNRS